MKALFDRCCGIIHCCSLEGKYGAVVETSGGGEDEEVITYVERFINFAAAGDKLTAPAGNLFVSGNWTNRVGASFVPNGGTVVFDGVGVTQLLTSGGRTFNNLTIARALPWKWKTVYPSSVSSPTWGLSFAPGPSHLLPPLSA